MMNVKKCAILIKNIINFNTSEYQCFIGVENGSLFLDKLNVENKHYISDFDSIASKDKDKLILTNENVTILPQEKEYSDTEEAILYAKSIGFNIIDIYVDESKGRKDHLVNVMVLSKKYNVNIFGNKFKMTPLTPDKEIKIDNKYKYLSIFVYEDTLLNTKGLKWDLNNRTFNMESGTMLISNEIVDDFALIKSDKKTIIFQSDD